MFKVSSSTISEEAKSENAPTLEWKFQISNGNTGEMTVIDPLLDSFERARERAMSELLKNAYSLKTIRVTTYRTDINKNDIVNVKGVPYLVKGMSTVIDSISIKTTLRLVRYE